MNKKKLLWLGDDPRMPSGVGNIGRVVLTGLKAYYDIVVLGGALNHPEKEIQMWNDIKIYPTSGYGDSNVIRNLMASERPDVMIIMTDPRFWGWLWQIEDEIRSNIPLMYYHVWDDQPWPKYNEDFYYSNDWIGCISKLTFRLVENIVPKYKNTWHLKYIPHGIEDNIFTPLSDTGHHEYLKWKKRYLGKKEYDFIVLYNNRNIRRKMPGDVMNAFHTFLETYVPKTKRDKCLLIMHTHPVDNEGTDLPAVHRDLFPGMNVKFDSEKINHTALNFMYNTVDVTINLASNEGYGLATAESLTAGTPIIVNVTGGLQDHCGFEEELLSGYLMDVQMGKREAKVPKHGKWVKPIFPNNRALVGSPPTPYIYDDRASWVDAADALGYWYKKSRKQRKEDGLKGREYLKSVGHTATEMINRFHNGIEETLTNFKPRKRIVLKKL